jgi:ATP-binding cassette subfamily F protein uup
MPLLRLTRVSLAYGHLPLLAGIDFEIDAGERVCVIGRNGAGKSTLFRVIAGAAQPDDGEVWRAETLRVAHLEQEAALAADVTVYQAVADGLGETGRLLADYRRSAEAAESGRRDAIERLATLQAEIEARHGWNLAPRVEAMLTRLGLPARARFADCSGGVRRQAMLARALVGEPDLLLLDEPTNHLDIRAIGWLEEFLLAFNGGLMFITHDRALLRRLATRIVELDRGRLYSFPGDYASYLRRKEELLEAEARAGAKLDRQLSEHEAWLRQGVKARRKRNQGRVQKLQRLRQERAARLEAAGRADFALDAGAASGKLVVSLRHVGFGYGEREIVRDFSTHILRGDRIGIVGPNGCGKSTLLRLILGELEPARGEIRRGTRLALAYFDQHRDQLDPEKTVRDNLSEGRDYIAVRGRSRHVIGYLKDFLFPPERIDSPVKALSGGERNRLLLAKILAEPANLLVLDEPTNDLDVETLELLEDLLADYDGTLLLVSHDRSFLDNVVTSTLVFEGEGVVREHVGGYEEWERHQRRRAPAPEPAPPAERAARPRAAPARARKVSYNESRELERLPARIEALEAEQARLHAAAGDPAFYQQPGERVAAAVTRLEQVTRELEELYARWEELEAVAAGRGD